MDKNKIEIKDLYLIFGSERNKAFKMLKKGKSKSEILKETGCTVAVNNASLSVREGEIFVIMGLSGSGKSSLLRCINRLNRPTSGEILINGEDIAGVPDERLRSLRRKELAMVFQHFGLMPHYTVLQNIAFGLELQGQEKREREQKAAESMRLVGLDGYADLMVNELSGGMQQRVGLARALANDPEVLLMDEAFSALDPLIRVQMQDELLALQSTITESDGLYKDFTSAIDDYVDFQNAQDPNGTAREHLVRLGNLLTAQGSQTTDLGMYAAKTVAANAAEAKKVPGIYFLENSVKKEALTAGNKNYGYYRLPYAKVYATYTPKQVWDWDADQGKLISKSGVKGETFYRGEGDGLIYASKEAARKSQLNPGQNAYTYTNGRCAYRALWNRQTTADGKTVVNADVRRNNTYLLTITAFQGLGMPWDPSDPKDPYLPKPDPDPTEPTNPENPDIEKEETYMRVEAKVLQWNLVSRDVVLE